MKNTELFWNPKSELSNGEIMTFTQKIKAEILKLKNDKKCCRKSMLYGMLLFSPWFEEGRIQFSSENRETSERLEKLIFEFLTDCKPEIYTTSNREKTEFRVRIRELRQTMSVFDSFGYADGSTYKILMENFMCESCRAAFLRGVFLACASTVSPESGYHLEFVVSRFNLSRELLRLLKICGYTAKYTKRNSHYIVYFKDSEAIVDLIAYVGAVNCSFEMTNLIIKKDIRNNCNRVANCETANIKRTVSTAQKQIDAINGLIKCGKFSTLSEEIRQTAELRVKNDDVSLGELAEMHSPPVTKSCVNHRLTKLCELWKNENNS